MLYNSLLWKPKKWNRKSHFTQAFKCSAAERLGPALPRHAVCGKWIIVATCWDVRLVWVRTTSTRILYNAVIGLVFCFKFTIRKFDLIFVCTYLLFFDAMSFVWFICTFVWYLYTYLHTVSIESSHAKLVKPSADCISLESAFVSDKFPEIHTAVKFVHECC